MREVTGDLWNYHARGEWITITTNGSVRRDGCAVMGRGVARDAARQLPGLQEFLGRVIARSGSHVWPLTRWRVFTFPVKWRWMERADLQLIEYSAHELVEKFTAVQRAAIVQPVPTTLYLVRPGCGNGGLTWAVVRPVLLRYLDDRFVVVERGVEGR